MSCPALCHMFTLGVLTSGGVGFAWTSWTESGGETVSSNGEDVGADFKRGQSFPVSMFQSSTMLHAL